uniref:hypothetical protein n=3 Tax=Acidithiobacillus thiooxidans TaxID=930 RepID=UPI000556BED2
SPLRGQDGSHLNTVQAGLLVFGESWDFHAAKVTAFILRSPEKPFVLLHQQLRWKVDRALALPLGRQESGRYHAPEPTSANLQDEAVNLVIAQAEGLVE